MRGQVCACVYICVCVCVYLLADFNPTLILTGDAGHEDSNKIFSIPGVRLQF